MVKNIKNAVNEFRRRYGVNDISQKSLCNVLDKQGYTVVFFNKIVNDKDVTQVVSHLNLGDMIACHNGFTYANEKYRLVFVNKELSEEERLMVLAHEIGHIFLEHLSHKAILGQDVKQEHEANEFAHYLLHPSKSVKARIWIRDHKKIAISLCACILLVSIGITVFSIVSKEKSYYGEYYVTSTGNKYHKKDCIFVKDKDNVRRLTEEEFESGEYEPCKTCLP